MKKGSICSDVLRLALTLSLPHRFTPNGLDYTDHVIYQHPHIFNQNLSMYSVNFNNNTRQDLHYPWPAIFSIRPSHRRSSTTIIILIKTNHHIAPFYCDTPFLIIK